MAQLKSDVPLLEAARAEVVADAGDFILPGAQSFMGKPVRSSSRRLVEAIAFERLLRGQLDARDFGIYSAFCTWKDFCEGKQRSNDELQEHVEGQFAYAPEDIPEWFRDIAAEVQRRLFARPIWGVGIEPDVNESVGILREGMAKLDSIQAAQFNLMNGMHEGGLFLPLAVVTDVVKFDDYAHIKCDGWQPDSIEEQERRTQIAYIKLLGDLGRHC